MLEHARMGLRHMLRLTHTAGNIQDCCPSMIRPIIGGMNTCIGRLPQICKSIASETCILAAPISKKISASRSVGVGGVKAVFWGRGGALFHSCFNGLVHAAFVLGSRNNYALCPFIAGQGRSHSPSIRVRNNDRTEVKSGGDIRQRQIGHHIQCPPPRRTGLGPI